MAPLRKTLAEVYLMVGTPADRLAADAAAKRRFAALVNAQMKPEFRIDADAIIWELLNMRKTGQLPRLERRYFGRNGNRLDPSNN